MNQMMQRRSLFPTFFKDVFGEDFLAPLWDEEKGLRWAPAVDVYEKEGRLHFDAELAGIDKKDIKVEFANGVLTISGERKSEKTESRESYFTRERYFGAFSRSFRVGEAYDPAKIEAKHKDGVLKVSIPKKEEAKPIDIHVN